MDYEKNWQSVCEIKYFTCTASDGALIVNGFGNYFVSVGQKLQAKF